jgi:hypothetical protein
LNVHQEWTDQLSDYLDGELTGDERCAVDAHLRSCAACAAVLNDLKRVVARAGSVEARPPQADLWRGIAARLNDGGEPARVVSFAPKAARRFSFSLSQLAAAAALQIAARTGPEGLRYAGGDGQARGARSADLQVRPESPAAAGTGTEGTGATDFARVEHVSMADAQYDAAVADLEKALKDGRGRLDASTIAIVEHNLQIIDQAINQAREALVGDPANSYLSGHLVEARRRKLDLLRRATALASETN